MMRLSRISLLTKTLLSTSVAITILFLFTGWLVQRHTIQTTSAMLEDEVRASFQAYESLWKARAANLASVSRVLASMSDVRAAFSTGDRATIRDSAGELWARISDADAFVLVTDPSGRIIASPGGTRQFAGDLPLVEAARTKFPDQASGFVFREGVLYQVTVTPVYVQSASGQALLNVLVAGYAVDSQVAEHLKQATGGSDFLFASGGRVLASTVSSAQAADILGSLTARRRLTDYAPLERPLLDVSGKTIGELLAQTNDSSSVVRWKA